MTYIDRLNCFWQFANVQALSTGQKMLYLSLLDINNGCYWVEWFTVANSVLQFKTGMSNKGINDARNKLVQVELIKYQRSRGNKAGKYKLLEFDSNISSTDYTQTTHKGYAEDTQTSTLIDKDIDIDKDIKREGCAPPSHIPSLNQIQMFCKEQGFPMDPQKFFDYYEARGWTLSGGRKIGNWQAAVRSWQSREQDFAKPAKPSKPPKDDYIKSDTAYSNEDLFDIYT